MSTCIEVKNLSVHYGQTEALRDVSFALEPGDFIGIAGPNGGGKTTLIKTILGLLPVTTGTIELFGINQKQYCDWHKIGYLPQNQSTINSLFPASVREVVMLGLLSQKKFPKKITPEDHQVVDKTLSELGILGLKNRMLFELSGGQQQKVLLARALVSTPEILIFDEPSTALDPESRDSFFQMIQKLNKQAGITIILITHDTSYIGQYANRLLYIDKNLVFFGQFSDFCHDEKMHSYFGKYEQHVICHQHH